MSEVRDRYVYVIEDIGGTPIYVGVGKDERMYDHVRHAEHLYFKFPHSMKCRFIYTNMLKGFIPEPYKVAENLTIEEAWEYERILIARFGRRDLGTGCLLNETSGGYGIRGHSEKSRNRIAEKLRGTRRPPEVVALVTERTKNALSNPAVKKKMSDSAKRRWASKEARINQSHATKQQFSNPQARANHSEITKKQFAFQKAREAHAAITRAQWASPEKRARILAGRKLKFTSEAATPE